MAISHSCLQMRQAVDQEVWDLCTKLDQTILAPAQESKLLKILQGIPALKEQESVCRADLFRLKKEAQTYLQRHPEDLKKLAEWLQGLLRVRLDDHDEWDRFWLLAVKLKKRDIVELKSYVSEGFKLFNALLLAHSAWQKSFYKVPSDTVLVKARSYDFTQNV